MKTKLNINVANLMETKYSEEELREEFQRIRPYFLELGAKIDTIYTQRRKNLEISLGKKGRFVKEVNAVDLDSLNKEYLRLERYLHSINLQARILYKLHF